LDVDVWFVTSLIDSGHRNSYHHWLPHVKEEILNRILDRLSGADLWIALGGLTIGVVCWLLIGAEGRRKVRLRQIAVALMVGFVTAGAICVNEFFFQRERAFPEKVTGILVMSFPGDDVLNTLRDDLVAHLNEELKKESPKEKIEVRASREKLD
jgi:hypothetical protein